MTTQRFYRCDLCSFAVTPCSGRGVLWVAGSFGEVMEFRPIGEAEHHICHKCAQQLTRLLTTEGNER